MINSKPTITQDQFRSYEAVRLSGVTNMFDLRTVTMLSGLDRSTVLAIMEQYDILSAAEKVTQ